MLLQKSHWFPSHEAQHRFSWSRKPLWASSGRRRERKLGATRLARGRGFWFPGRLTGPAMELQEGTPAHAPQRSCARRQALFGQDTRCGLQAGVPKAVISRARLWAGVASTKPLFLAKAKAGVFRADIFFSSSLSPSPLHVSKPALSPLWGILLVPAYHGAPSRKPSQVRPAPRETQRNCSLQPWSRMRGLGGAGAGRRLTPEVQEKKGGGGSFHCRWIEEAAAQGPGGAWEEGCGSGPLGISTGQCSMPHLQSIRTASATCLDL